MRVKILALLVLFTCSAFAQGGSNSVYSQFGLGMLYPHQFGQSFGMGNTGIAMNSSTNLNLFNPASLGNLKYVTFDVNAVSNSVSAKDGVNDPASYTDASLGTIGVGVPLLKGWGAMAGLTPFASMGYRVKRTSTDPILGTVNDYYHGAGGLNTVFIGTGYQYRNFSVGGKMNYVFGTILREKLRALDTTFTNSYVENQYGFSNLTFDFGAQYQLPVNDNLSFTLGAVYGLQQMMNVSSAELQVSTSQNVLIDVLYSGNIKNVVVDNSGSPDRITVKYPSYFGAGLTMNYKEKVIVTADYKQQEWSNMGLINGASAALGRSINVGAQYVPNAGAVGNENYQKRVAYRCGLRYGTLPLMVNGSAINDFGLSLGMGFPLRKLKFERELFGSYINLGFEIGRRGSLSNGLVQEDYYKFNLGFTFNDKWFIKRKLD